MALISCSECGRQVSDKALSCPNCGMPLQAAAPNIASSDTAPSAANIAAPSGSQSAAPTAPQSAAPTAPQSAAPTAPQSAAPAAPYAPQDPVEAAKAGYLKNRAARAAEAAEAQAEADLFDGDSGLPFPNCYDVFAAAERMKQSAIKDVVITVAAVAVAALMSTLIDFAAWALYVILWIAKPFVAGVNSTNAERYLDVDYGVGYRGFVGLIEGAAVSAAVTSAVLFIGSAFFPSYAFFPYIMFVFVAFFFWLKPLSADVINLVNSRRIQKRAAQSSLVNNFNIDDASMGVIDKINRSFKKLRIIAALAAVAVTIILFIVQVIVINVKAPKLLEKIDVAQIAAEYAAEHPKSDVAATDLSIFEGEPYKREYSCFDSRVDCTYLAEEDNGYGAVFTTTYEMQLEYSSKGYWYFRKAPVALKELKSIDLHGTWVRDGDTLDYYLNSLTGVCDCTVTIDSLTELHASGTYTATAYGGKYKYSAHFDGTVTREGSSFKVTAKLPEVRHSSYYEGDELEFVYDLDSNTVRLDGSGYRSDPMKAQ